ncbi:archease [Chloroflexota bacterium]
MDKEFEILEHTADIGIIAYGGNINAAFVNAAKGMFSLITEPDDVEEVESRDVDIEAADSESLLVAWLNELIFLFDAENMLFKRFDIIRITGTYLKAAAFGEKVDMTRHDIKMGIKAATWHMLKIEKSNGIRAQVLFDI